MPMNLMPWIILWALITTGVLLLALWRLALVRRESALGGLHVAGSDEKIPPIETKIARMLARVDFWGKTLTVLAGVLVLAIGAAWLYNGWLRAAEVVH
jgi:type VI protein secretion system component VasK